MRAAAVLDPVAQPVRNYVGNPNMVLGANGWTGGGPTGSIPTLTHLTSGGPFNGSFVRATLPGDATVTNMPWLQTVLGVLPPGETFHLSAWVRVSRTTRIAFNMVPAYGVGETFVFSATCEAGKWTLIAGTFRSTASAASTTLRLRFASATQSGPPMFAGDTLEFTRVACARADADPGPVDGTTPGLRWSGTTDYSQSVCYPYTLESIAGRPAAWYDARHLLGKGVALPADGTAVSQWVDLSGNGRHLAQATASRHPLFRSANPNRFAYADASAEAGVGRWQARAGCSVASSTDSVGGGVWPPYGTSSLKITATGTDPLAETEYTGVPLTVAVTAGRQYTFEANLRITAAASRTVELGIEWFSSGGTFLSNGNSSATIAAATNTRRSVTLTAPTGAAFAKHFIFGHGFVSGEIIYADQMGFTEGGLPSVWMPPVPLPGGRPAVQFDGLDDYLITTGFNGLDQAISVYGVYYFDALLASTQNPRVVRKQGGGATGWGVSPSTTSQRSRMFIFQDNGSALIASANPNNMTFQQPILSAGRVRVDGGGSYAVDNYDSGNPAGAASLPNTAYSGAPGSALAVGGEQFAGNHLLGGIATVVAFEGYHNDATRNRVEKWLGATYGIAVA